MQISLAGLTLALGSCCGQNHNEAKSVQDPLSSFLRAFSKVFRRLLLFLPPCLLSHSLLGHLPPTKQNIPDVIVAFESFAFDIVEL